MRILMSPENPDGWKLEELLRSLQNEVYEKSAKIAGDESLLSKTVQNHNLQIIGLLAQAEGIQRQSFALLDDKGPNQGPTGVPRIGGAQPST